MWQKGHNVSAEDEMINQAVETMGMLETGVNIDQSEIVAWEGIIMQVIKSKINEEERKQFAEDMVA